MLHCNIIIAMSFSNLASTSGVDPGYCERGSEHKGVSLMQRVWGAQPHRSYRVFVIITPKSCLL